MSAPTLTTGLWIHGYEYNGETTGTGYDVFDAEVVAVDLAAGTVTVTFEGGDHETDAVVLPAGAVVWNPYTSFYDADFDADGEVER